MLDQSFSSENFNIIYLIENRKGTIKKEYLSEEYFEVHNKFKNILDIKNSLKLDVNEFDKTQLDSLSSRLQELNNQKERIRKKVFYEFAEIVNIKSFRFELKYDKKNEVFITKKDGANYYAMKQLQRNIHKTFKVVQSDRNKIVKQLHSLLSDGYPKILIRTDIVKFYETIPHKRLFEKIENNTLLSVLSKKMLRSILFEFERIKDKTKIDENKGIPRGLGVSAYLSELYMRDVDNAIKSMPDIVYYARYVDDIVVVFSPKSLTNGVDYLEEIKDIVKSNDLDIHKSDDVGKTKEFNLLDDIKKKIEFEYLGYKFIIQPGPKISMTLSSKKKKKYEDRIDKMIISYNTDSKFNEKLARNMLIDRIKFLSGNYNLNHNKKGIKSGIYYSNIMLKLDNQGYKSLECLSKFMYEKFKSLDPPKKSGVNKVKLAEFLKEKFCFVKGFENKSSHFHSFKFNQQEKIKYKSQFGDNVDKFAVIKSIWQ